MYNRAYKKAKNKKRKLFPLITQCNVHCFRIKSVLTKKKKKNLYMRKKAYLKFWLSLGEGIVRGEKKPLAFWGGFTKKKKKKKIFFSSFYHSM